ncbi:MAG: tetratricopeptide repeat protein [Bacteroides sp.]|nr:tetratricopeptide repeat protein [Bacteroides sp.]
MKRTISLFIAVVFFEGLLNAQSYQLNKAKSLIANKQYTEAAKTLRPLADGGDAEAQYLAGTLFLDGLGVIKSEDQGVKYLSLSASMGYVEAAECLIKHFDGKGNKAKAVETAKKYVEQSAEMRDAYPGAYLAGCYVRGEGVEKDLDKAMQIAITNTSSELSEMGIVANYESAKAEEYRVSISPQLLELIYKENPGFGELCAFDYINRVSSYDDILAQANRNPDIATLAVLSKCIYEGWGVKQNHGLGHDYALKAGNAGSAMGKYLLKRYAGVKSLGYRYKDAVLFEVSADKKSGKAYSRTAMQATWKEIVSNVKSPWRLPTMDEAKELIAYWLSNQKLKEGQTVTIWVTRLRMAEVYYWQTYDSKGNLVKEEPHHNYKGSAYNGKAQIISVLELNLTK